MKNPIAILMRTVGERNKTFKNIYKNKIDLNKDNLETLETERLAIGSQKFRTGVTC